MLCPGSSRREEASRSQHGPECTLAPSSHHGWPCSLAWRSPTAAPGTRSPYPAAVSPPPPHVAPCKVSCHRTGHLAPCVPPGSTAVAGLTSLPSSRCSLLAPLTVVAVARLPPLLPLPPLEPLEAAPSLHPSPPAFPAIKTINPASSAPRLPGAAHTTPRPHHSALLIHTIPPPSPHQPHHHHHPHCHITRGGPAANGTPVISWVEASLGRRARGWWTEKMPLYWGRGRRARWRAASRTIP